MGTELDMTGSGDYKNVDKSSEDLFFLSAFGIQLQSSKYSTYGFNFFQVQQKSQHMSQRHERILAAEDVAPFAGPKSVLSIRHLEILGPTRDTKNLGEENSQSVRIPQESQIYWCVLCNSTL